MKAKQKQKLSLDREILTAAREGRVLGATTSPTLEPTVVVGCTFWTCPFAGCY